MALFLFLQNLRHITAPMVRRWTARGNRRGGQKAGSPGRQSSDQLGT